MIIHGQIFALPSSTREETWVTAIPVTLTQLYIDFKEQQQELKGGRGSLRVKRKLSSTVVLDDRAPESRNGCCVTRVKWGGLRKGVPKRNRTCSFVLLLASGRTR